MDTLGEAIVGLHTVDLPMTVFIAATVLPRTANKSGCPQKVRSQLN